MKPVIAPAPDPEAEPEVLIVATVSKLKWTRTTVPIDPKSTAMVVETLGSRSHGLSLIAPASFKKPANTAAGMEKNRNAKNA